MASMTVSANAASPTGLSGNPHFASSAACGSIPTQSGPRLSIAA